MNDVTQMRKKPEYMAHCPECRGTYWLIRLDGIKDDWENIIGTECVGCGFFVEWVRAKEGQATDG